MDVASGAPAYTGQLLRQLTIAPLLGGASAARPLGGLSGVRPGTPSSIVSVTSTTWTVSPFGGTIDLEAAATAGPYAFAFNTNQTGNVTAANTNPRVDLLSVRINDSTQGDGTTAPGFVDIVYTAGTPAASNPSAPAAPARSFPLAWINVPASGGGSPTVTWVAWYTAAAASSVSVVNTVTRAAQFVPQPGMSSSRIDSGRDEKYYSSVQVGVAGWYSLSPILGVFASAGQTVGTGVLSTVGGVYSLQAGGSIDAGDYFSGGTGTVTISRPGLYSIQASSGWSSGGAWRSFGEVVVGGVGWRGNSYGDDQINALTGVIRISSPTAVSFRAFQASGGNVDLATVALRLTYWGPAL